MGYEQAIRDLCVQIYAYATDNDTTRVAWRGVIDAFEQETFLDCDVELEFENEGFDLFDDHAAYLERKKQARVSSPLFFSVLELATGAGVDVKKLELYRHQSREYQTKLGITTPQEAILYRVPKKLSLAVNFLTTFYEDKLGPFSEFMDYLRPHLEKSGGDPEIMKAAAEVLDEYGIPYEAFAVDMIVTRYLMEKSTLSYDVRENLANRLGDEDDGLPESIRFLGGADKAISALEQSLKINEEDREKLGIPPQNRR